MSSYVIFTDSACDLPAATLKEWNVKSVNLTFHFDGETVQYDNDALSAAEFYGYMKQGKTAKTAAINTETFRKHFRRELEKGNDILYLGFSSGLSSTYSAGNTVARELKEEYPDRKILTVDTLSASTGEGLLVDLVKNRRDEGASVEEAARYAESMRLNICHWFTVDTLEYLKRGGRVSATTAWIGDTLNIKPLMHVDNEGHLVGVRNVRGKKNAINGIARKMKETALDLEKYPVYICNSDCKDTADMLANSVKELCGANVEQITDIGPVIGAHTGPGTVALFFVGKER
ncbi:MAG: DegV family protein [Lachnospiraceae bacterium]|nr:DegV family protein [Lachnospiraceae bacterium]